MDRLEILLENHPLPTWRTAAWPVMILMSLLLVWANFSQLDEVTVATGEVVPQGKVKVIQHLEGGIIQDIFVSEGSMVHAGEHLIQLDLGSAGTNKEELQVRLDDLILIKARFLAEAEGTAVRFPDDIAARQPAMVASQRSAYEERKREFEATINVLARQAQQKELEVEELKTKQRTTDKNLKLARQRFEMSKDLLKNQLTPRMEHLQLEAQVESLEGELQSVTQSIPRAEVSVQEAKARLREGEIRFRREAKEEIGKAEQNIARLTELMTQATEQGLRTDIKSPIDGVVKNMRYNTLGGVVKAGEPIMEIVPTGDKLVVDARLNPTDRGYVEQGQRAVVKISTYDFVRYGSLEGVVIQVAPDSTLDEKHNPYFRVVVETEKTYLGDKAGVLPITPGMQATVDIHTGQKSVMDYLVKPVLKLRHEAFRER